MSEEGRSVRLTIPAKPEYITLGRLALTAIAGVRPVSDEALHDLKLALTEFVQASVSASLRSWRVSSSNGRTPAIALSASLPSVMYSARAGIVRRTKRPSSLIPLIVPLERPLVTRRNPRAGRRRSRVGILVRLGALAEAEREHEPRLPALD